MVFDFKSGVSEKNKAKADQFLSSGAKNLGNGVGKTFIGLGQLILGILIITWIMFVFLGRIMINYINKQKEINRNRDSFPKNYSPNKKNFVKRKNLFKKKTESESNDDGFLNFRNPLIDELNKEEEIIKSNRTRRR